MIYCVMKDITTIGNLNVCLEFQLHQEVPNDCPTRADAHDFGSAVDISYKPEAW